MQITRISGFTGKTHTLEIDVTEDQLAAWRGGQLIQHAMPTLTSSEREFLMTGVTAKEWDDAFAKYDDS